MLCFFHYQKLFLVSRLPSSCRFARLVLNADVESKAPPVFFSGSSSYSCSTDSSCLSASEQKVHCSFSSKGHWWCSFRGHVPCAKCFWCALVRHAHTAWILFFWLRKNEESRPSIPTSKGSYIDCLSLVSEKEEGSRDDKVKASQGIRVARSGSAIWSPRRLLCFSRSPSTMTDPR